MHLAQIKVQNFRNLADFCVDLETGLNVLVGRNDVGKSNLFDAVRHALGPSSSPSDPIWLTKSDLHHGPDQKPTTETISVSLTFSGLDTDDRAQFFEILDFQDGVALESTRARVHYQAAWEEKTRRFKHSRWGGSEKGDRPVVPQEILDSLRLIFLPALRDAQAALTPGNKSVLARLLNSVVERRGSHEKGEQEKADIEAIFKIANDQLKEHQLIKDTERQLRHGASSMSGIDHVPASLRAAKPEFQRILRTLELALEEAPVEDLSSAGLGYNNLLYIATVLSHLEHPTGRECPVLLVEEPEAHLSPQLTALLARQLRGLAIPQVVVSTHSPTFATQVNPSQVHIMAGKKNENPSCLSLHTVGLKAGEERKLRRMLDITKATLYFARGVILVEGVSEALLVPELALSLGIDLTHDHVAVIPVCGVSFETLAALFPKGLDHTKVAVITDLDPPVLNADKGWREHIPDFGKQADRIGPLKKAFHDIKGAEVFTATVTLEYDLALAGDQNAAIMAEVWKALFTKKPQTFNSELLADAESNSKRALIVWRGICRAASNRKADFANVLADWISENRKPASVARTEAADNIEPGTEPEATNLEFSVPLFIEKAIRHVVPSIPSSDSPNAEE